MSICSDIFISKKDAKEKVLKIILSEQEELIKRAVNSMSDFELTNYLNKDVDLYYYNIEKKNK